MKIIENKAVKRTSLGLTESKYVKEMVVESDSGVQLAFDIKVSGFWGQDPSEPIYFGSKVEASVLVKEISNGDRSLKLAERSKFGAIASEILVKCADAQIVKAGTIHLSEEMGNEVTVNFAISDKLSADLNNAIDNYMSPEKSVRKDNDTGLSM